MATTKEKLQVIIEEKGLRNVKRAFNDLDKGSTDAGKGIGAMAMKIGAATIAIGALTKGFSAVMRTGMQFEQSMANLKAVTGSTSVQMINLSNQARQLGASTAATASEVAGLQTELGKLGFTTSEIQNATEGVLSLSLATGTDLAQSSAIAGATLRAFNMDASEMGEVVDVMAQSFRKSALDMDKFSNSMTYVAPVAKRAGFEIDDTTSILGTLANRGIDGSIAGTSLRQIFLQLSDSSSKLSQRLGGPISSMDELVPALQRLNDEGIDNTEMLELVGKRAVSAFGVMVSAVPDIQKMRNALTDAGGTAQSMADTQMDTLQGSMTKLKSAVDGLGLSLFDYLVEPVKALVDGFTGLVSGVNSFLEVPLADKLDEERVKFERLILVLKDTNTSTKSRELALSQLREEYGEYLGDLTTEEEILKNLDSIRTDYLRSIREEVLQDKHRSDLKKLTVRQMKAEDELLEKEMQSSERRNYLDAINKKLTEDITDAQRYQLLEMRESARSDVMTADLNERNSSRRLKAIEAEIEAIMKEQQVYLDRHDKKKEVEETEIALRNKNIALANQAAADASDRIALIDTESLARDNLIDRMEKLGNYRILDSEFYQKEEKFFDRRSGQWYDIQEQKKKELETLEKLQQAHQKEWAAIEDKFKGELKFLQDKKDNYEGDDEQVLGKFDQEIQALKDKMEVEKQSFAITEEIAEAKADIDKAEEARKKELLNINMQYWAGQVGSVISAGKEISKYFGASAETQGRIQQAGVAINTAAGMMAAISPPTGAPTPAGYANMAVVATQGAAQYLAIEKQINDMKTQKSQTGFDGVVTEPTLFMAGEAGAESVQVNPLGDSTGGGREIVNVNFYNSIMTDEFVEDDMIPRIKEVIRKSGKMFFWKS